MPPSRSLHRQIETLKAQLMSAEASVALGDRSARSGAGLIHKSARRSGRP